MAFYETTGLQSTIVAVSVMKDAVKIRYDYTGYLSRYAKIRNLLRVLYFSNTGNCSFFVSHLRKEISYGVVTSFVTSKSKFSTLY